MVKRLLIIIGIVSLVAIGITHFPIHSLSEDKVTSVTAPTIGVPQTLDIPTLHIHAHIESVGLDTQQRMAVPKDVNDVGWYSLGYKPGENGSAVIDGHYDTPTGAPAVFYAISQLKKGDTLHVTDDKGKVYSFAVIENVNYPYDSLPLKDIFASKDTERLNLITCSGVWDKQKKNYSTRDVVYAVKE